MTGDNQSSTVTCPLYYLIVKDSLTRLVKALRILKQKRKATMMPIGCIKMAVTLL